MPILNETALGFPQPHPSNDPYAVDVQRIADAIELIDAAIRADRAAIDDRAIASDVTAEIDAAIATLKGAAPAAYDTLVEVANKLASNDDVVAALMTAIGAKASQSGVDGAVSAILLRIVALETADYLRKTGGVMTGAITFVAGQVIPGLDVDLLNSVPTLRKDLLLSALQAAAASGDSMRLSAGFIDPYSDVSDVTLTDVFFNIPAKMLSIGASAIPVYPVESGPTSGSMLGFTGSDTLASYLQNLSQGSTGGAYVSSSGGGVYYYMARPLPASAINTIEIMANAGVWQIDESDDTSVFSNVRTVTFTDSYKFYVIDCSSLPYTKRYLRISQISGNPQVRAVTLRQGKRANYLLPTPTLVKMWGNTVLSSDVNPVNGTDLAGVTYSKTPSTAHYLEVDFPSAVRLAEIDLHNWGGYQISMACQLIEGSNDKTTWTPITTSQKSGNSGNGSSGLLAFSIDTPGSYRYYRATFSTNNGVPIGAFSFLTGAGGQPIVVSATQTAAAAPASARIGVQIKPLFGATIADFVAEVSRNGGTNWSPATLAKLADQFDGFGFYEALVDLTGQPSGTQMKYRLRGLNDSRFDIGGTLLQWS
jgi:hypothetical protein